ncbi:MAG: hypothetical protein KC609_07380, partial [Myxococcales bacterium]|nr:hypothetical protein [Myxococcales bacterium]
MNTRTCLLAVLLACSLLAVACGGGSSNAIDKQDANTTSDQSVSSDGDATPPEDGSTNGDTAKDSSGGEDGVADGSSGDGGGEDTSTQADSEGDLSSTTDATDLSVDDSSISDAGVDDAADLILDDQPQPEDANDALVDAGDDDASLGAPDLTSIDALLADVTGTIDSCIVYVATDGNDGATGLSWGDAVASVRRAVEIAAYLVPQAKDGRCEVWIKKGVYSIHDPAYLPKNTSVLANATIALYSNVGIFGGFDGDETQRGDRLPGDRSVLDGKGAGERVKRIFDGFQVDHVILDSLVITGSDASVGTIRGGGLYLAHPGLDIVLRNLVFVDNLAQEGAAIAVIGETLDACLVRIENSVFADNRASKMGGAVHTNACRLQIVESVFSGNRAPGLVGGALMVFHASANVLRSVFAGNSSPLGGAVMSTAPADGALLSTQIVSSIFVGNLASTDGGALMAQLYNELLSVNNTFYNNSSDPTSGAGTIRLDNVTAALVRNSILRRANGKGEIISTNSTATVDTNNIDDASFSGSNGNVNLKPLFKVISNNSGAWTDVSYAPAMFQTTLSAGGTKLWAPDSLIGRFVVPNTGEPRAFVIIANTFNKIVVWGNLKNDTGVGKPFALFDPSPTVDSPGIDVGKIQAAPNKDFFNTDWSDTPDVGTTLIDL